MGLDGHLGCDFQRSSKWCLYCAGGKWRKKYMTVCGKSEVKPSKDAQAGVRVKKTCLSQNLGLHESRKMGYFFIRLCMSSGGLSFGVRTPGQSHRGKNGLPVAGWPQTLTITKTTHSGLPITAWICLPRCVISQVHTHKQVTTIDAVARMCMQQHRAFRQQSEPRF